MLFFCVIWIFFFQILILFLFRSAGVKNLIFLCENLSLEFIVLITFRAIVTRDIVSCNIRPKYVTFDFGLICIFLQVMFSFETFFILNWEAKCTDLVLFLQKWILSLLSINHSQMSIKSPFNCFSISKTYFPCKSNQHIETGLN